MKRCSTCHRELPAAAFGRRTGTSDGLNYRCRRCNSAAAARSRATNRSFQRIEQAQCFARWSMANDPTRLWHQRARWVR